MHIPIAEELGHYYDRGELPAQRRWFGGKVMARKITDIGEAKGEIVTPM